jgi:predicted regulator of Ras-like GTPase activity (Roadblock/LC7/MglB family)
MTVEPNQIAEFGWLIDNFAENTPGVAHAVVISVDGILLTGSARLPRSHAELLAAISAGIVSLNLAAAKSFDSEKVLRAIVEMDQGALLLTSIKDGSCLAVLAGRNCDISQVAYEMNLLVDQVGTILTPRLRAALAAG